MKEEANKNKVITLLGLPGAGKTTITKKLREIGYEVIAESTSISEIAKDNRVEPKIRQDKIFDILSNSLKLAKQKAKEDNCIVYVDRDPLEVKLFDMLFGLNVNRDLPCKAQDITRVYIHVEPFILKNRIRERNRADKDLSQSYIDDLYRIYEYNIKQYTTLIKDNNTKEDLDKIVNSFDIQYSHLKSGYNQSRYKA